MVFIAKKTTMQICLSDNCKQERFTLHNACHAALIEYKIIYIYIFTNTCHC